MTNLFKYHNYYREMQNKLTEYKHAPYNCRKIEILKKNNQNCPFRNVTKK